jgi:hypothetical protein
MDNEANYLALPAHHLILGAVEPQHAIIMHNSPRHVQPDEAETGGCIDVYARRDISGIEHERNARWPIDKDSAVIYSILHMYCTICMRIYASHIDWCCE